MWLSSPLEPNTKKRDEFIPPSIFSEEKSSVFLERNFYFYREIFQLCREPPTDWSITWKQSVATARNLFYRQVLARRKHRSTIKMHFTFFSDFPSEFLLFFRLRNLKRWFFISFPNIVQMLQVQSVLTRLCKCFRFWPWLWCQSKAVSTLIWYRF